MRGSDRDSLTGSRLVLGDDVVIRVGQSAACPLSVRGRSEVYGDAIEAEVLMLEMSTVNVPEGRCSGRERGSLGGECVDLRKEEGKRVAMADS